MLDVRSPIIYSLWCSLPVFIIFAIVLIQNFRSKPFPHRQLIAGLILGLISISVLTYTAIATYNAKCDKGIISEHEALVVDKTIETSSKGNRSYYIHVPSWGKRKKFEEFEVSNDGYSTITVGSTMMRILTKPGKFGFEWLVRIEKI